MRALPTGPARTVVGLLALVGTALGAGAQVTISTEGAIQSTSGGLIFPDGTTQTAAAPVPAPVPGTGQTTCWDAGANPIACAGTGQDADHQAGVEWPDPRFSDNGDGTVTDNLTGLVWLKDANCFGLEVWVDALSETVGLASGACGLTDGSVAGDWRMPDILELWSLIDFGQSSPALPAGHPFSNVQSDIYWSSSSVMDAQGGAWNVDVDSGKILAAIKWTSTRSVWPVRGGPF